jgi:hypothetical protein
VKLLALLMPCAMLAVLWALQRLEVWMDDASGPHGLARTRSRARRAVDPARRRMRRPEPFAPDERE